MQGYLHIFLSKESTQYTLPLIADVLSGIANHTDLQSMPTKKEALIAGVDK